MTTTPSPSVTVQWTRNQQEAIDDRGRDLVVSASAGSGKTAVLTERVLRLVSEPDEANGAPRAGLEELLIITFTDKAARQMRERIEKRILGELTLHPDSPCLQNALDAISSSWIMTIDAFCRRLVIEHFHQAGISPAPRIPDKAEQLEMELSALNSLLQEWAAAKGEESPRQSLNELLRCQGRGADELIAELRSLMHYLQSLDRPRQWLARVRGQLDASLRADRYPDLPEAAIAGEGFGRATRELLAAFRELIELAGGRGGETGMLENWRQLALRLEQWSGMPGAFRPDPIRSWLAGEADEILGKLGLKKVCGARLYGDEEFKKNFLVRFSRHYLRWRAHWFPLDEAGLFIGAKLAARQGLTLLELAELAQQRIDELKQRRGLMTFNDFERTALKILTDPAREGGPSEIAAQLQRQFKFILVDEYQDTSPLQDAIIRLVSHGADCLAESSSRSEGNLFLVGDYKQSIYRFRHAEPTLFLEKLTTGAIEKEDGRGIHRIDLRENFRSRPKILEFINHCFRRLMDRSVGELEYGEAENLVAGRLDPAGADPLCVEVQWMARIGEQTGEQTGEPATDSSEETPAGDGEAGEALEVLEGLAAQAQWVARRIRELTDPQTGLSIPEDPAPGDPAPPLRRARPGDCAILLRSIRNELEIWVDALEREGLKVRSPGLNPLYSTSEMVDLLNALRIADNPMQDIPLASLMRSPMIGFTEDDLLRIRLAWPRGAFHEAVWGASGRPLSEVRSPEGEAREPAGEDFLTEELRLRLNEFIERVDAWREMARRRPADELLGRILRDTGYEAFLMGHLDGLARLEHVDFLRGLLLQFGRCDEGANPLAGFLEAVEQAETEESEIGELPETVAGENDAVNLLTVHRGKGLEFPIVFLPRLERRFRERRISETLCDREGGLARQGVDTLRRRRYPTLAHRNLSDRLHRKDRSEEIRLLYVAMTRARERLILIGQMKGLDKLAERWATVRTLGGQPAGALERLHAASPADLLGPIVEWLRVENKDAEKWLRVNFDNEASTRQSSDIWTRVRQGLRQIQALTQPRPQTDWQAVLTELGQATPMDARERLKSLTTPALRFLPAIDPARALTTLPAKMTVTRLKQNQGALAKIGEEEFQREETRFTESEMQAPYFTLHGSLSERRPNWVRQDLETPKDPLDRGGRIHGARRGTLTHALLAHLNLKGALDAAGLRGQAAELIGRGLIGDPLEEKEQILASLDFSAIVWFFSTEMGQRMIAEPGRILREHSFTAGKYIHDFDLEAAAIFPSERILVQGIIDAILDEGATATVIDYKTDRVHDRDRLAELSERYRIQIEQYAHSLQAIWKLKAVQAGLVFLDAREIVWVDVDDY